MTQGQSPAMKHLLRIGFLQVIGLFLVPFSVWAASQSPAADGSDEFLRGYTAAIIKMNFAASARMLRVEQGVLYIENVALSEEDKISLQRMLFESEGFVRIELVKPSDAALYTGRPRSQEPPEKATLPAFLPKGTLFRPLIADPRWPHFSAAYQRYLGDKELQDVGAPSFGETFSLYRFAGPWDSSMEVGIQAGVFSIFDLDAESYDLINADYLVGVPLSFKSGNFSNHTSVFHQSSHLGDEFVLRNREEKRVNLSYESVSTVFSYHLPAGFRPYAGGGYIFHRDPSDLDPWSVQVGLEYYSPWMLMAGALRPVAAIDVQYRQENNWSPDLSIRAGVQFQNPDFFSRKMMLLLEYYNGQSPNGQFYERDIESLGLGLHFFLE
jgi:Protein of unknown function (DUF1207)